MAFEEPIPGRLHGIYHGGIVEMPIANGVTMEPGRLVGIEGGSVAAGVADRIQYMQPASTSLMFIGLTVGTEEGVVGDLAGSKRMAVDCSGGICRLFNGTDNNPLLAGRRIHSLVDGFAFGFDEPDPGFPFRHIPIGMAIQYIQPGLGDIVSGSWWMVALARPWEFYMCMRLSRNTLHTASEFTDWEVYTTP